jgi:WD40 repeat protein
VAVLEGQWRNQLTVHRVSDGAVLASMTAPNFYDNGMGSARGAIDATPDLSLALFADFPSNPALTAATLADGATTGKACAYGHSSAVISLGETQSGQRLVSGGGGYLDETQIVWDTHTGAPVAEAVPADLETMDPVSPNGQYTAVPRGDDSFEVRDNSSESPVAILRPHITHVRRLDWSGSGKLIVSTAERDPVDRGANPISVKVWDFASRALVQTIEAAADDLPALFAAHGDTLYVAGWNSTQMWCR